MDCKINDIVLYGADGVCRISEVTERKIGDDVYKYFILIPVYDEKSTIFVPLGNQKLLNKIRHVLSEDEILQVIERVNDSEPQWILNDSERRESFRKIIEESKAYELLSLLKLLYAHQAERVACGKKLHVADERTMKEAEKILCDEISYALKVSREAAGLFIREKLGFIG